MSTVTDFADAVVLALNGHGFGQSFTARRLYLPVFDLKDMKDLHVTVVPKGVEMTSAGRGLLQSDVQIDVAVQKKLPKDTAGDPAFIDGLMSLVQEIGDFIRRTALGDVVWARTENTPVYSVEHLSELRQFTSVLTLTLRTIAA